MRSAYWVLVALCFLVAQIQGFSYDSYQIYEIECENVEKYGEIMEEFTKFADGRSEILSHRETLTLLLSDKTLEDLLIVSNVIYPCKTTLIVEDVGKAIRKAHSQLNIKKTTQIEKELREALETKTLTEEKFKQISDEWFTVYHDYEGIVLYLESLHEVYPSQTNLFSVGKTYENRTMQGIRLSGNGFDQEKKEFIFNACQHAREWISPATVTFVAYSLLSNGSAETKTLLNNFYYSIIPVTNPDGYSFTWTKDRLWRKNRRVNEGSVCMGVDLNRNWGYNWNGGGDSSPNPCSSAYHGAAAFSEPETSSLSSYISTFAGKIAAYIDFHSYSQFILTPWSFTPSPHDYTGDQLAMGDIMAAAIAETHQKTYQVGDWYTLLYDSSGVSIDWVLATLGAIYSYTIELRDTGTYGFLLPADQIIPTGQEIFNAMLVLGNTLNSTQIYSI